MPTLFTHPAVPLALALGFGRKVISGRLLLAGMVASVLPDFDVIAFRVGVPYAAEFGHRGFSHSLIFACIVAVTGGLLFRSANTSFYRTFWFLFVAAASHGILDACTNGGLGVAFFWPWTNERYFAPLQFIQVSPLSITRFASIKGIKVLGSELLWVWFPLIGIAATTAFFRWMPLPEHNPARKEPRGN